MKLISYNFNIFFLLFNSPDTENDERSNLLEPKGFGGKLIIYKVLLSAEGVDSLIKSGRLTHGSDDEDNDNRIKYNVYKVRE